MKLFFWGKFSNLYYNYYHVTRRHHVVVVSCDHGENIPTLTWKLFYIIGTKQPGGYHAAALIRTWQLLWNRNKWDRQEAGNFYYYARAVVFRLYAPCCYCEGLPTFRFNVYFVPIIYYEIMRKVIQGFLFYFSIDPKRSDFSSEQCKCQ